MTTEEYRKAEGLNFSAAKWLLRSPAHFKNPPKFKEEEKPALQKGTLLHAYVLEGKELPYRIKPAFNPNGDEDDKWHGAKKWSKAWLAESDLPAFTEDEVADQAGMRDALKNSPEFQSIAELCPEREKAVFAEYRGVKIKALLDLFGVDANGLPMIGDLKTTSDGSPKGFAKSASTYRYPMQSVWYSTAVAMSLNLEVRPGWLWVTVESQSPYAVTVYSIDDDAWDLGQRQMDYCIDLYKRCQDSGEWPAYGNGIQRLQLPKWALEDYTLPKD